MTKTAIIAITANGARLAEKLSSAIPGNVCFISERYSVPSSSHTTFPPATLGALIRENWGNYRRFIFIMAIGIVVRKIAALIADKESDPGVVVIDDAGKFAVSILSGHLGGGNSLAEECATIIGAVPVITTATDVNALPSFDMISQNAGLVIDDIRKVKLLNRMLLDREKIAVVESSEVITKAVANYQVDLNRFASIEEALGSGAEGFVIVTNSTIEIEQDKVLILRPKNILLGIGCNRGTSAEEIERVVQATMTRLGLSMKSVAAVATADAKRDEQGLLDFAEQYRFELKFYTSDELNEVTTPSPASGHAMKAIGAKGVAEPAAILAANHGRLVMKKEKSGNVTIAVAEKCWP